MAGSLLEYHEDRHERSVTIRQLYQHRLYLCSRELVQVGKYPNMSAAVSGELAKAKAERERGKAVLEAELERRLTLPLDQWEPVGNASDVTAGARAHLTVMNRKT